MTSPKLEALRTSLSKAIDARHEREIEDDIRREEEHLRTCPFAKQGDRFEIAAADLLGLPQHSGQEAILKTIRDLKTAERAASRSAAALTGLAIDRGDALDRLLAILKAPLRYDGGEPLTQEERIEWAIRRAPKT